MIIGHKGAAGIKPGNTLDSIKAGLEADVDMIEFDVRLTKDKVPVLLHDKVLWRSHRLRDLVNRITFDELSSKTKAAVNPVTTLDQVLKDYGGQVLLCLDIKDKGGAARILPMLSEFIKKDEDWEQFLLTSRLVSELRVIRKYSKKAQLGLIHWHNPLTFLFVNKQLNLTAVGFHRLHINTFTIAAAKKLGLFTYCYTVNRPEAAERLARDGIDGIVTDVPHIMAEYFRKIEE